MLVASRRACQRQEVVRGDMKLMKTAALAGIAKKLHTESRKPENQARIRSALAKVRGRGQR